MSKAKKYGRWQDLKRKTFSDAQLREIRLMVEQEKRESDVQPLRLRDGVRKAFLKQRAVRQAGQVIVLREVRELLFETLAFNGVADRTVEQIARALALDEIVLSTALHGLNG